MPKYGGNDCFGSVNDEDNCPGTSFTKVYFPVIIYIQLMVGGAFGDLGRRRKYNATAHHTRMGVHTALVLLMMKLTVPVYSVL